MSGPAAFARLVGAAWVLVRSDALLPRELDLLYPPGVRTLSKGLRLFAGHGARDGRPGERLARSMSLARDDFEVVDSTDRVFFRDIYDHLVRLHDLTESMRDLLSGTMDAYLSVINNRMNEVMKLLAVITTLFMPISFVTGFFGMNFFSTNSFRSLGLRPCSTLKSWIAWLSEAVSTVLTAVCFALPNAPA